MYCFYCFWRMKKTLEIFLSLPSTSNHWRIVLLNGTQKGNLFRPKINTTIGAKRPGCATFFHFNVPRALGAVKVRFRWKCANRKLGNLAIWSKVQQFIDTVLFWLFLQISESKYCFPVLTLKLKKDSVPKMVWPFTVWINCSSDLNH